MPDESPATLLNDAIAFHRQGDKDGAAVLYRRVLAADPSMVTALHMLGVIERERGSFDEALELLARAAASAPGHPEIAFDIGMVHKGLGQLPQALEFFRRSAELDPGLAAAHYQLGAVAEEMDDVETARQAFGQVISLQPGKPEGYLRLGKLELDHGRIEQALAASRMATEVAPDNASAWYNLGLILAARGEFNEAETVLKKALALEPIRTDVLVTLAQIYADRKNAGEALTELSRVLDIDPGFVPAHLTKASILFSHGDFAEGWQEYGWRQNMISEHLNQPERYAAPLWDGESLAGKHVLLTFEQGLGEQVMFASMLSDVLGDAASVTLECEGRLIPLLERVHPGITYAPTGALPHPSVRDSRLDVRLLWGQLGAVYRQSQKDFPVHDGYLIADPGRTVSLAENYRAQSAGLPLIGVSWRSFSIKTGWSKSLPLNDWAPILSRQDVFPVDVQYGDTAKERSGLGPGLRLYHDPAVNAQADLDSAAAQIAAMDAVITTSNTAAHLAGALGKPTLLLLPHHVGHFWYWFPDQGRTPWYPSLKVLQAAPGETRAGFVARAAGAADKLMSGLS